MFRDVTLLSSDWVFTHFLTDRLIGAKSNPRWGGGGVGVIRLQSLSHQLVRQGADQSRFSQKLHN